jgi:hypothetical protein
MRLFYTFPKYKLLVGRKKKKKKAEANHLDLVSFPIFGRVFLRNMPFLKELFIMSNDIRFFRMKNTSV